MKPSNIQVSIIVPAYNEEGSIRQCILQAYKVLSHSDLDYEIIVVDDSSKDRTFEIIKKVAEIDDVIRVIRHERNQGKCKAIRTGLGSASGDIICILDADLEYNPADVPRLVEPITLGIADAVYGSRFTGKCEGMSLSHTIGNKALTYATNILFGTKLTDVMTGSKAFKRKVINDIDINSESFEFEVEATSKLAKKDFKIVEIPIEYSRRSSGRSKISWVDGLKCLLHLVWYNLVL